MEEWKEYRLGDVCSQLSDGLHKAPKFKLGGDYIFVNAKNISNGFIVDNDLTKKSTHEEYLKYSSPLDDTSILYSIDGTIGNVALYRGEKVILGKGACYLNPMPNILDRFFLYYELLSPRFKAYIDKMSTGSTIKHISLKTMRNYSFVAPPLQQQRQIACILSSIDNKITCNRQINDNFAFSFLLLTCFVLWLLKLINDNLLQQADALFKSWFVDFEPFKNGEFEESGLGFIPKGWNVYEFGRVLSPVNEKVGDRVVTEYSVGNTGIRSRSDIYHKAICSNPEKNRIIRRGNLVFGMGNDRVTWGIMKDEIGATSPAYPAYKIDESIDYIYFEFFFKHYYAQAKDLIRPSVRQGQTIDKGALMQKKIYVPSKNVWDRFLHIHNPIIETSRCVEIESDRLSELRDVLLPRLMSGELKVSEMIA